MNKIRIKSTPVFDKVAAVIGEERAQIELAIAYHGYGSGYKFKFNTYLFRAFAWNNSPQGHNFWMLINDGINPCSN